MRSSVFYFLAAVATADTSSQVCPSPPSVLSFVQVDKDMIMKWPWHQQGNHLDHFKDKKHTASSGGDVSTWEEVAMLPSIYLNLGGGPNKNGVGFAAAPYDMDQPGRAHAYDNYVSVEGPATGFANCQGINQQCKDPHWCVCHDLSADRPLPLLDNSVDRIHSEDAFEHISQEHYSFLLMEFHRVLRPGGRVRLSMPDYNNPKDAFVLQANYDKDPRNNLHITITNYALLKSYVDQSPFRNVTWLNYFDNAPVDNKSHSESPFVPQGARVNSKEEPLQFVQHKIDYTLGWIKRTPDHDPRDKVDPLQVTSLVVDLVKDVPATRHWHWH